MPQTKTRKGNIGKSLSEVSVISEVSAFSTWPKVVVRKTTLQYGLCSISFNGAKIWNNIPPEIRDSPSVRTFKNKLKNFLLDSYIS